MHMKPLKNMQNIWRKNRIMEINMYDDNLNFELFSQNCIDGEEIPNIQKLKILFTN